MFTSQQPCQPIHLEGRLPFVDTGSTDRHPHWDCWLCRKSISIVLGRESPLCTTVWSDLPRNFTSFCLPLREHWVLWAEGGWERVLCGLDLTSGVWSWAWLVDVFLVVFIHWRLFSHDLLWLFLGLNSHSFPLSHFKLYSGLSTLTLWFGFCVLSLLIGWTKEI